MKRLKTVSTHQPSFLPWFGLIYKIKESDYFILLDDVQFNKRSFQHRAFYSNGDKKQYLSISVKKKDVQKKKIKINEIKLQNKTQTEIYQKLFQRYHSCKGWNSLEPLFRDVLLNPKDKLIDITYPIFQKCVEIFNIKTKIFKSSEFNFSKKKK